MRRLVEIIDACGASGIDPETVFAWIEDDLRAPCEVIQADTLSSEVR